MIFSGTQSGWSHVVRFHEIWSDGPRCKSPVWSSDSDGVTLTPLPDGSCLVSCETGGYAYIHADYIDPVTLKQERETYLCGVLPEQDIFYPAPKFLGVRITGHQK